MKTKTFQQRSSLVVGLAVSIFFLWLGFRGLDFGEIWDTLREVNFGWIALGVPVYFVAVYILAWRWHYLLAPIKPLHPHRLFPIVVIGYMANNLLPLRLGEVMRAYVLKRRDHVPIVPTLTTILIERVFDGLVMLAFILSALLFVDFEEPTLRKVILLATPLFFGALLVFFWLAMSPEVARRWYSAIIQRFIPNAGLREKILGLADELMRGFASLRSWRALGLVVFYSVLSWSIEASIYWIVMQAFQFEVSFYVLMLVIGFGNLSTILPSTAGYVGTFHAVAILTLVAFDVDRTIAGSYAILMHATLWLPITVAGLVYLLRLGLSWSDFQAAQEVVREDSHPAADETR